MADDTRLNQNTTTGDLIVTDSLGGTPPNERKVQAVKVMLGADGDENGYVHQGNPMPVTVLGSAATNLGKAEDAAHSSGDVGVMMLGVRRDTPGPGGAADGDYAALSTDATGALRVDTELPAAAALADGATNPTTPMAGACMMVFNGSTWSRAVGTGGTQFVQIFDPASGEPASVDETFGLDVDVTRLPAPLTITGIGTGGTSLRTILAVDSPGAAEVVTEDSAASGNPFGSPTMLRRRDTPTAEVSTDGDYVAANASNAGAQYVELLSGTAKIPGDATNGLDVDVTRIVPGTGATNLGKAEDAAHASGDVGVMALAVRRDSASAGGADGDYVALSTDSTGALRVTSGGGGGGGTASTDDGAFTIGSTQLTPVGGLRNDSRDTVDDGDTGVFAMTPTRALYTSIETPNGDTAMDETNNSVRVTIVAGAGSGGTSMTDDAPFTVGTSGVTPAAGIYRSSRDLVDDNDAGAFAMTQRRALLVQVESSGGTELGTAAAPFVTRMVDGDGDSVMDNANNAVRVNVVAADPIVIAAGSNEIGSVRITDGTDTAAIDSSGNIAANIIGRDAHDAAVSGNPVGMGARASTATPTAVSADDNTVRLWASRRGALHVAMRDDDGDSCMDNTNAALRVNVVAGAGSGGTAMTDDAAFTPGTTSVTPVAGTYRTVRDNLDDNDAGAIALSQKRGVYVVLESPTGNSLSNDTDASVRVSGTYADGEAHVSETEGGVRVMGVRRDTPTAGSSGDGSFADLAVDANGRLWTNTTVGTGATDLGKAEDAVHASADVGVMVLAVRRDTAAVGSGTDGDYSTLNVNSAGRLYTSSTIDAALPAGTNNIGDVDIVTVPAPLSTTGNGTAATALRVTIANDSTGVVQDNASLVDNAGFTDGTSRVLPAGFIFDETAGTALTENDAAAARIDSKRAQINTIEDATTRGQRVAVNAGGALEVHGDAAHDAAVAGNPVLVGYEARTSDGTAVANGDAVRAMADKLGKQIVHVGSTPEQRGNGKGTFTNTTAADILAAPGANIRWVVTNIKVVNAHATVGTKVEIRDGTTVIMQGFAAALGGGWTLSNPEGIFHGTGNTAITARNVTTGADVDVFCSGYKEPT